MLAYLNRKAQIRSISEIILHIQDLLPFLNRVLEVVLLNEGKLVLYCIIIESTHDI